MKKKLFAFLCALCVLCLFGFRADAEATASGDTPLWTYQSYLEAMTASGREKTLDEESWNNVQKRKEKAMPHIEKYLTQRFRGYADPDILRAFQEVPREYYCYHYQQERNFGATTYEIPSKPWGIGYGSAISDYCGQAYMTQLAKPRSTDVVLEIGTGSGYQSSIFSRIVREVYSIEILEPLGKRVASLYEPLGYDNVHTRVGDGYFGWPEVGSFDIIMLTCSAQYVSPELLKQLKPGGRLIVPIGQPFKKGQFLYVFTKDENGKVRSRKDMGVYFIPMTGEIQKRKKES